MRVGVPFLEKLQPALGWRGACVCAGGHWWKMLPALCWC